MKRLAFLISFAFLACGAFGQATVLMPLSAGDTVVNTGTVTKTLPVITTGGSGIVIGATLTKISGTGAGTAQLQTSMDGTNFVNSGSAYTITNVAAQACLFTTVAPVPAYLRVLFTGSGTEAVQVRVYYRSPKYQVIQTL